MSCFCSRYELLQFFHVSFQFLHLLVMLRTGNETVKINLFICIGNIFEFFFIDYFRIDFNLSSKRSHCSGFRLSTNGKSSITMQSTVDNFMRLNPIHCTSFISFNINGPQSEQFTFSQLRKTAKIRPLTAHKQLQKPTYSTFNLHYLWHSLNLLS